MHHADTEPPEGYHHVLTIAQSKFPLRNFVGISEIVNLISSKPLRVHRKDKEQRLVVQDARGGGEET